MLKLNRKKTAALLDRSTRVVVEALEHRTLLSATLSGTTLNVTGTSTADTFTLSDSGTTITVKQGATTSTFADSAVSKIVVNPTAGGDTVNLLSNTKPVTITGGGLDTVNIGNSGSLQGIAAAVSVSNPSSFTNLSVDSSAFVPQGTGATLTASTISGYSAGTITYTATQLSALTISSDYSVTVNGTGVLHNSAPTIINGGGVVTLLATTGPLTINADQATGPNTIGGGNTQSIKGNVILNTAPFGGGTYIVNDSSDTVGRNVTIDSSFTFTGLSPGTITLVLGFNAFGLTYNAGSGNDTLNIDAGTSGTDTYNMGGGNDTVNITASALTTQINGNAGNDQLTVGNGLPPDNTINFDGSTGVNSMTFNDSGDNSGAPYFVNGTSISYLDAGHINGTNVQSMAIDGGTAGDTFNVGPSVTVPLLIQGGSGDDNIFGGGGNETLLGGDGNDTIIAGTGNDSLNGGSGTNSLVGGDGIDTLNAGDGTPVQIIADNIANAPSAGSQGVTVTGNWISSTSATSFYGTNYINDNNSLKGTKSVTWTPSIPTTGSYHVYARWPAAANRATNVPFTVTHQGTNTTVVENQQTNDNAWVLLGTFALNAGTSSSVTVSNTGTNGFVIADAVRFVSVGATATLSGTTLNINGTGDADNITLSDNGATITLLLDGVTSTFADSSVSKIIVNPSAGGDTVNLRSNTKPVTITGGGLDTVNITNNGSLLGIAAAVSIDNPTSFTNLTLDCSADPGGLDTGALSATALTGFSPGAINYNAARLSALTINIVDGITVNNTGVLHNSAATVINGGSSNIFGTTGPLVYNLAGGNQMFFGSGNMQSIKGQVNINSDPAFTGIDLHINDSTDTVGRNVNITGFLNFTGFSPAPIFTTGTEGDSDLFVFAGTGNDTLNIAGGAFDADNDYDLGAGNDTVNLVFGGIVTNINGGPGNDTLNVIGDQNTNSIVNYDGGADTNSIVMDQTNTVGSSPSVSAGGIGFGLGAVGTTNVQNFSLFGGTGDNTFTVDPGMNIPVLIHGGPGNDTIFGGAANDSLFGDAGNDSIVAGAGNDYLNGGEGTDSLIGGPGIDTLDGGDGAPIQIIADNAASAPVAGGEGVTLTGNWIASTSNPGFYGPNYITDNNSLKGTKSATFTPNIPTAGSYQVYARWTAASNRATNVPFSVSHQGITSTVTENQQLNNNAWVLLGTFTLNAGTGSSVTVSNTGTNGYVIADAVRFVPVTATASISGTVFNDSNGNGKQDAGEAGVANRVVYIDSNKDGILDNAEPQTTTDSAGYWTFTGLSAGTYRVREQNVAGVLHTDPSGSANFYDVPVTTGATASAIYGKLFGEEIISPSPAPILAINAGGPTFILNSGVTYSADTSFTGGTATTTVFDVANTDNDPIYYSYRTGASFSYSLSVPNGNYSLVLNFVDPTKTAAGQRKFNVTVQGKQVLTNFDIVASAGAKTAISKSFAVTVTNGKLTIALAGVIDNAILSGIVLYPS